MYNYLCVYSLIIVTYTSLYCIGPLKNYNRGKLIDNSLCVLDFTSTLHANFTFIEIISAHGAAEYCGAVLVFLTLQNLAC